ncbi:hypothetical protein COCOBI_05-1230 [Coccomyxa sp. Obi]|nr:hypothetical protein COCOBI_05-1230 [Coccomyxa sp. Obi]
MSHLGFNISKIEQGLNPVMCKACDDLPRWIWTPHHVSDFCSYAAAFVTYLHLHRSELRRVSVSETQLLFTPSSTTLACSGKGTFWWGMLITLSILGGLAGVTGAASLTRYFCETFGKDTSLLSRSRSDKSRAGVQLRQKDSIDVPVGMAEDAQLIRSMLDDAEITLRGLRRERPGPSRSFKIIKLVESYHPELQPNNYQKKILAPLFAHVSDVVRNKAAHLLKEDLESSLISGTALDDVHLQSVTAA